jgi:hypothetical protein
MTTASFANVLREARKLPPHGRTELIAILLSESGSALNRLQRRNAKIPALEILTGVSSGELEALANAILAPSRQRRLLSLLRKNKTKALSVKERKELDEILEESDRMALLKAKAQYTLIKSHRAEEVPG